MTDENREIARVRVDRDEVVAAVPIQIPQDELARRIISDPEPDLRLEGPVPKAEQDGGLRGWMGVVPQTVCGGEVQPAVRIEISGDDRQGVTPGAIARRDLEGSRTETAEHVDPAIAVEVTDGELR